MRGNKKLKLVIFPLLLAAIVWLLVMYFQRHNVAVLDAKGPIARRERNLFYFGLVLSALVVIPVYIMTIGIIWKYRENNPRSKKYQPDWDGSRLFESVWWGVPCLIILVLSIVTWNSSHSLDPYKPLPGKATALDINVIALNWKWLFVYPEQNVASVNLLELPVGVPVNFEITSDGVMNSFWIPNLGSQIYAMPGMNTELHLMADTPGSFPGSSANISGKGFADMTFMAHAVSGDSFKQWVNHAKKSPDLLTMESYRSLSKPSENNRVAYYSGIDQNLYLRTVLKYMTPPSESHGVDL